MPPNSWIVKLESNTLSLRSPRTRTSTTSTRTTSSPNARRTRARDLETIQFHLILGTPEVR